MDMRTLMVILIVVALIIISLLAAFLYFKEADVPTDQAIVYNYMPQYADGHDVGLLVRRVKGPDRDAIIFRPTDYNHAANFRFRLKTEMKDEIIFVEKEKVKDRPRGILSEHKHELILLPPKPEDLPESFKKTPEGKALMKEIEEINNNTSERDILRESSNRKNAFLRQLPNGEISEEWMDYMNTAHRDTLKMASQDRNSSSNRPSPLPPLGGINPSGGH